MYEVEIKIEITPKEQGYVVSKLIESSFIENAPVSQTDYYVEAQKSPYGGYNLKRYRNEDRKLFFTQKTWEMVDNEPVRKEEERKASQSELEESVKKSATCITIKKDRRSFEGFYKNTKIHIDMDTVKFNHSNDVRYFIEAEILTDKKEEIKNIKYFIRDFLKELLEKEELSESPGMFTMAFDKR